MMANFGLFTLVENVSRPVITIIDHANSSDIAVLCLYRQEKYDLDCHWPLLTARKYLSLRFYLCIFIHFFHGLFLLDLIVQFLLNQSGA